MESTINFIQSKDVLNFLKSLRDSIDQDEEFYIKYKMFVDELDFIIFELESNDTFENRVLDIIIKILYYIKRFRKG